MSKQWVIRAYSVPTGNCRGYFTYMAGDDYSKEVFTFTQGVLSPTVFATTTRAVSWLRLVEAHFSEHLSGLNKTLEHLFFCLEEYKQ